MVIANCFNLDFEGLIPTAKRTCVSIVEGGATVEPFRFVRLMYKFCIAENKRKKFISCTESSQTLKGYIINHTYRISKLVMFMNYVHISKEDFVQ